VHGRGAPLTNVLRLEGAAASFWIGSLCVSHISLVRRSFFFGLQ
jgi:hypothetical protein